MNTGLYEADVAEGKALLHQLPNAYETILRGAQLEPQADRGTLCKFEVPGIGMHEISAPTAREAIRLALVELSSILTSPNNKNSLSEIKSMEPTPSEVTATAGVAERFHSKARRQTIGATVPTRLKHHLHSLAKEQGTSFADLSRRLTVAGFEDFDEQSFSVGSESLFSDLTSELRRWRPSDSEQVMLRLELNTAIRLRATAKEYQKSASELGAMCLSHGLALHEKLTSLENKIKSYRGAAIRPLAAQLEISEPALLSGVLVGTIRAPKLILTQLSVIFGASESLLTEFFRRSFTHQPMPSFKARDGKPEVSRTPQAWEDAVKALNLPSEQTKKLLDLDV